LLPNNPADQLYTAFIGGATPIACATMDTDPMWSASGSNEWSWGLPNTGDATSGDPIAAHTGSNVLGTIVGGFTDGFYPPSAEAAIAMPAIDVSSYEVVHLQYWRWLTVEDGAFDQAQILANGQVAWANVATPTGLTDHVDHEWRFQDLDVSQLVDDGLMQIQWTLTSDASYELGGWNLDDVCLVGLVKLPKCGDGVLDPDEQCDDGNDFDGDGCSADCKLEIVATGGGCATSSPGSGVSGLLVALLLASSRRRLFRRGCRSTRAGRADRSRS
jgi:cysteine-rich repeat protein